MNKPISIVTNEDCMSMMSRYPDKFFQLAIVDPPYGLQSGGRNMINGNVKMKMGSRFSQADSYNTKKWDLQIPTDEYFVELFRVSNNQIIWGANYFNLPAYRCPIIWDKMMPITNFSAFELAYTSFDEPSKIFQLRQAGFVGEYKIHPTQKPVALYSWLLKNYAKPGDKILDTHLGSGSSRIAAYKMGFDFYGCELDKDYFEAQEKRFKQAIAEPLFDPPSYQSQKLF